MDHEDVSNFRTKSCYSILSNKMGEGINNREQKGEHKWINNRTRVIMVEKSKMVCFSVKKLFEESRKLINVK